MGHKGLAFGDFVFGLPHRPRVTAFSVHIIEHRRRSGRIIDRSAYSLLTIAGRCLTGSEIRDHEGIVAPDEVFQMGAGEDRFVPVLIRQRFGLRRVTREQSISIKTLRVR